jgi:hypothetical protein
VERGLWEWGVSLYRSSVRVTWRHKRRLWRWEPLSMEAFLGNLGEGSYAGALHVEEGFGACWGTWRGVSIYQELWELAGGGRWRWAFLSVGTTLGNLEGGSSTKDFERSIKGALGMGCLSLKRLSVEGLWGGYLYEDSERYVK